MGRGGYFSFYWGVDDIEKKVCLCSFHWNDQFNYGG